MPRILLLLYLLLPFQAANSVESTLWKDLGIWSVRVDQSLDNGCFVFAIYERNSLLRFGFNIRDDNIYLLIYDDDWESLEEGKIYEIELQFDNEGPWVADAKGVNIGEGQIVLWANVSDTDFFVEFQERHVMKVFYMNEEILRLELKGSYKATQEMIKCQFAMNQGDSYGNKTKSDPYKNNDSDPFSSGSGVDNDPFK